MLPEVMPFGFDVLGSRPILGGLSHLKGTRIILKDSTMNLWHVLWLAKAAVGELLEQEHHQDAFAQRRRQSIILCLGRGESNLTLGV
jgi:hypothetical protein